MKFAHVALWTHDLKQAATFWRRYFGAEVGDRYQSKRRPGFVSCFVTLPGGRATIELMTGSIVNVGPGCRTMAITGRPTVTSSSRSSDADSGQTEH